MAGGRRSYAALCLGMAVTGASKQSQDSTSLLRNLPTEYSEAPWQRFQGEPAQKDFSAFVKEVEADADGEAKPAVVKVLARARIPVRALLDTFLSEDERVVSEWNPFAGEVLHIDKVTQLQTYRLPWPFASREYLVRCVDVPQGKSSHQAHCASIDEHPSAPVRSDRVRGRSETVWRFTEDKDGQTSIHLETLVDPRGGLPTWIVDKAGKSASVKIVRALIKYTSDKYKATLKATADMRKAGKASRKAKSSARGEAEAACKAASGALLDAAEGGAPSGSFGSGLWRLFSSWGIVS